MRSALRDAEIAAEQISFVNAHGTSTKLNDKTETTLFREGISDGGHPHIVGYGISGMSFAYGRIVRT